MAEERDEGDGWPSLFKIRCGRFKIVSKLGVFGRRQKQTCAEDSASPVVFSWPAFAHIPKRL